VTRISSKSNSTPAEELDARGEVVAHTLRRVGDTSPLDRAIGEARNALIAAQDAQGYWLYELEADCTIPAEYIMMMHFLDEIDAGLQQKIAVYLRSRQGSHGGWPLYQGGDLDISGTVKAYYALKLAGDSPNAPHMQKARAAILQRGGAAKSNVFTRIALAQFEQLPWRAVPYIPVEIMLLPRWFPFHLNKVAYWSRTVMVPLFILCTLKTVAKNPLKVGVGELFRTPPDEERHYFRRDGWLAKAFLALDHLGRLMDPFVPARMRRAAIAKAEAWFNARLNGEDGLGAIFPAMVNAVEAMVTLGYAPDDPRLVVAKRALQKLLVFNGSSAYCQPCVSPIWDTALACLALQETGDEVAHRAVGRALDWLKTKQLLNEPGDWQVNREGLAGGGWAFQFANDYYPDLDDTAVVAWSMHQARDAHRYEENVVRALDWLVAMQSRDGGFAAFDADNTHYYLNKIPFADHGALLDPPTSDVTARVVTLLCRTQRPEDKPALERALRFLRDEQEEDGSWFGRWGTNHIYGTWSVLMALAQAHVSHDDPSVKRAVLWLKSVQNEDGGWGESNDGYAQGRFVKMASTPYHTAWAMLALLSAGEAKAEELRRAAEFLVRHRDPDGLWSHPSFTAPGFPRVFYLKYHGYCAYFPLWALAAYRSLTRRGNPH
jgi:squalene-hopene/tetraprenyl-beta-curcumene cyclase